MASLEHQIQYFASEVLNMLDSGAELSIETFVEKMENKTIIDYVHTHCPHKNFYFSPENAITLKEALGNMYVSENEGYKKRIENNGLIYLLACLMELLEQMLFEYKCAEYD